MASTKTTKYVFICVFCVQVTGSGVGGCVVVGAAYMNKVGLQQGQWLRAVNMNAPKRLPISRSALPKPTLFLSVRVSAR